MTQTLTGPSVTMMMCIVCFLHDLMVPIGHSWMGRRPVAFHAALEERPLFRMVELLRIADPNPGGQMDTRLCQPGFGRRPARR